MRLAPLRSRCTTCKRHPRRGARPSPALRYRAAAVAQRPDQLWQTFGRVLAVAVHQRHEIEAAFDRKVVADLLIAAVTLVHRVEQHVQRERDRTASFGFTALLERPIA
jgi:hypothetical protein